MKKVLLIVLLLWTGVAAKAQQDPDNNKDEQIKAIEIGYFTKELNLTTDEAQKFWPVFNQYREELTKARIANKDDAMKRQEAELNVRKQFKPNFLKAISPEKLTRFWAAEERFRNALGKEIIRRKMLQRRRN